MSLISWNKPKKIRSTEEHNQTYLSDSGVEGTYVPNMPKADRWSWKGKLVGQKTKYPQVELRRGGIVIVISLHGYKYKHYNTRHGEMNGNDTWSKLNEDTAPTFHLSSSGPIQFTWEQFDLMNNVVEEAKQFLLVTRTKLKGQLK